VRIKGNCAPRPARFADWGDQIECAENLGVSRVSETAPFNTLYSCLAAQHNPSSSRCDCGCPKAAQQTTVWMGWKPATSYQLLVRGFLFAPSSPLCYRGSRVAELTLVVQDRLSCAYGTQIIRWHYLPDPIFWPNLGQEITLQTDRCPQQHCVETLTLSVKTPR
jgi:hypothetical protein